MDNSHYPWIILVPERPYITEITDLTLAGRSLLVEETAVMAKLLQELYQPDKINIASLGNVVPQFHTHIIARFKNDLTWPDPVWGKEKPRQLYTAEERGQVTDKLLSKLILLRDFHIIY